MEENGLDPEIILLEASERMDKTVDVLRDEMQLVRTGRANPGLLEGLRVNYYGTMTPLAKLANVSAPEGRLLTVQPFDPSSVEAIEAAIRESELGLNPSSTDGHLIRVPIPELSEERRKDLIRHVRKLTEDARIAVRNIRREANDHMKKVEHVGEDETKRHLDEVQKTTDDHIKILDGIIEKKEKDLQVI